MLSLGDHIYTKHSYTCASMEGKKLDLEGIIMFASYENDRLVLSMVIY